jgi:hypothetical protein
MRHKILILALMLCPTCLATSADGDLPPVLELIDEPQRLTVLAIDAAGERAVGAMPEEGKRERSLIMFYSTVQPESARIEVAAQVRDLLLAPDGSSALALLHKSAKKREGDTFLVRVEPSTGKAKRLLRLPPSAVDLAYFPVRDSLLVACRYEIRTLLLPDMRSGPLYRVGGGNRAIAALGRSSRVLVGQEDRVVLLDLDATHGRDEMPVEGELPLPQPVNTISAAEDGSYALVTLADYSVHRIDVATLALIEPPEPEEMPAAIEEEAPAEPEQPVVAEIIEEPEPEVMPVAVEEEAPAEPERPVAKEIIKQQPPEPEEMAAAIEEKAPAEPEPEPQVRGRILGEHVSAVVAVLLLGPNNILNEAARVIPKSDGSWSASGLKPGRYRIQLDGGGRRVLVSEPSFLLLEIKEEGIVEAGDIRLLKAL